MRFKHLIKQKKLGVANLKMLPTEIQSTRFVFFVCLNVCVHGGCSTYFHRVIICKTADREGHNVNNKEKIGEKKDNGCVCITHTHTQSKEILVDNGIVEKEELYNQRVQRSQNILNKHIERKRKKTRPKCTSFCTQYRV